MASQELTSKSVPISTKGVNGGLNNTASPLTVAQNESSKLQNIDFDKFGSAQKRNGYINLNAPAPGTGLGLNSGAQINGMHWFEKRDGTKFLIVVAGSKIYKADGSALTQQGTTFTDITGSITITPGYLCKFVTFLDSVCVTNGYDAPFQWTGSGNCTLMTIPTNITRPRLIEQFQNYTFLADSYNAGVHQGSRLNWSVINNTNSWLDTDFAYISWNDGTDITAIKTLGDRICIFKQRSIWIGLFTGDVDVPFQFQKTQSSVGCISGYSPFLADNGVIFLGEDGLYFFDGNGSEKLSNRLNETFYNNNAAMNNKCCSMYQKYKNRYWISQFTGANTTADQVVTFDSYNNAFGLYSGMTPSYMCMVYNNGQEIPLFGDYSGWVYQADTGLNDYPAGTKTAIDSYFYTRWLDYDDLVNQKGMEQVDVYYKLTSATLTVVYSYDFEEADQYSLNIDTGGSGTTKWDTNFTWGVSKWAGSGGQHYRLDFASRGRVVRIGFKNANIDESFRFDGIGQLVHLETNA